MNSKKLYAGYDVAKMFADINARHEYLLLKANPIAMKFTIDAVLAQSRTKAIAYIRNRAKVPRWVVARKLPPKLQRKAQLKDFYRNGRMSAKSHILMSDIQAITLLSKRATGAGATTAPPVVDTTKMAKLAKSKRGINLGKAGHRPNAFVADGRKRENDEDYNNYVIKVLGARQKVLRGKYWQVLEREGKTAYPIRPVTIPISKYAGRALKKYTSAIYKTKGAAIFQSKQAYAMNSKVKF